MSNLMILAKVARSLGYAYTWDGGGKEDIIGTRKKYMGEGKTKAKKIADYKK